MVGGKAVVGWPWNTRSVSRSLKCLITVHVTGLQPERQADVGSSAHARTVASSVSRPNRMRAEEARDAAANRTPRGTHARGGSGRRQRRIPMKRRALEKVP